MEELIDYLLSISIQASKNLDSQFIYFLLLHISNRSSNFSEINKEILEII